MYMCASRQHGGVFFFLVEWTGWSGEGNCVCVWGGGGVGEGGCGTTDCNTGVGEFL